jgi:DGQHR domain-containing protein
LLLDGLSSPFFSPNLKIDETLTVMGNPPIQAISVIVPKNPFVPAGLSGVKHCLAALDVEKLMKWWPGTPHVPHHNPKKVKEIQRSLDWKRVAQIAAYLLQEEIVDAPALINKYFKKIYGSKAGEPGREWPPKVPNTVGYQPSDYPTFSNVLLHVNGATIKRLSGSSHTAKLVFREDDKNLNFTVIDGQHRINGAYFAVRLKRKKVPDAEWQIPAEIFVDLDKPGQAPKHQAQIFIDVNFNQKKVDKSLVADLFPTARGERKALNNIERAQDIGRRLMLEVGPLVGMIQIPGIRFGLKDVVALATLNSAIEDELDILDQAGIQSLESQSAFFAQCIDAWLEATGRKIYPEKDEELTNDNVAYQGRFIVSSLKLIPACIHKICKQRLPYVSEKTKELLRIWFREVMIKAKLIKNGTFLDKKEMHEKRFLGTGGIALFRDALWAAAIGDMKLSFKDPEILAELAQRNRDKVMVELREML